MGKLESCHLGHAAADGAPKVAVLPSEAASGTLPLLARAGCELGRFSEGEADAVLVVGAVGALSHVVEVRSAGFRGGILCALEDRDALQTEVLRTAGANAVETSADPERLLSAVVAWRLGQGTEVPALGLEIRMEENTRRIGIGVVDTSLSASQYRLLAVLAQEPGRWWKSRQLVAAGLGTHHADDSSLIRVHMNAIRKQLGIARWCLQSERTFGYQLLTNADALPRVGSRRAFSHGPPRPKTVRDRRSGVFRVRS